MRLVTVDARLLFLVRFRDGNNVLKALRLEGIIPLVPASDNVPDLLEYELKYYEVSWLRYL